MPNMENKGSSRFDTGVLGRPEGQTSVTEKAKEMGSQVSDKAKEIASSVSEQAGQVASRIGEQVSHTYEAGRDYIQHRGVSGMAEDVTDIIRRNPLPAMLVGVGLGFLLARALRED